MKFEDKVKKKLQQKIIEEAKRSLRFRVEEGIIENREDDGEWYQTLTGICGMIDEYYKDLPIEQVMEISKKFRESISNESLNKMKKNIQLTEEEERYIIYEEMKNNIYRGISPISQVLLRRKLIEFIKENIGIDEAIEILKTSESDFLKRHKQYICDLITGGFFKSEEEFQKRIEKETEQRFNHRINCGGYALELDGSAIVNGHDFEKAVSELLEKVKFIRLLGDTKLADDEYLVMWRVDVDGGIGHHFVKVQKDGVIIEKDGIDPIQMFSGWALLEECPEAVFAVKKDHDMYLDNDEFVDLYIKCRGLNFEETVKKAIQEQRNLFEYHNHLYFFKKDSDGNVYICSEDRIIADAFIEDEDCLVDIKENEKNYVSNTQPSVPFRIAEGKIQNYRNYKNTNSNEEREK